MIVVNVAASWRSNVSTGLHWWLLRKTVIYRQYICPFCSCWPNRWTVNGNKATSSIFLLNELLAQEPYLSARLTAQGTKIKPMSFVFIMLTQTSDLSKCQLGDVLECVSNHKIISIKKLPRNPSMELAWQCLKVENEKPLRKLRAEHWYTPTPSSNYSLYYPLTCTWLPGH